MSPGTNVPPPTLSAAGVSMKAGFQIAMRYFGTMQKHQKGEQEHPHPTLGTQDRDLGYFEFQLFFQVSGPPRLTDIQSDPSLP